MSDSKRKIAVCQARPATANVKASVGTIIEWMKKAARAGADIALFGELFLSNYDLENISTLSEPVDGPSAKAISQAAKQLNIAVIYGYSEVENSVYYDSLMFIDENGVRLANYRKVHVWPGTEDLYYDNGDAPVVVNWGSVKVGLAICVDVCMSEFISVLAADGGAQLIVVATALVDSPRYEKTPLIIVPARAYENRCYIAYTDLAGERYSGMSRICDPYGECITSTKTTEEALLMATIPFGTCANVPFRFDSLTRSTAYVLPYEVEIPWKIEERNEVQKFFSNRAHYYDQQMDGIYNGPKLAASALSNYVIDKKKKVLDIAAGTGLVGKALSCEGFINITALDMNLQMLEEAKSKNVYSKTICGTFEEEVKNIPKRSFHACICVGAFLTAGFLDPDISISEMINLTEKGGYLLLLVNNDELDQPQCLPTKKALENACETIVTKGLCECVQKSTIPNYLEECNGKMWIFKTK